MKRDCSRGSPGTDKVALALLVSVGENEKNEAPREATRKVTESKKQNLPKGRKGGVAR